MSDLNGRNNLDLSDLIGVLHVKAGEVEFDLPMDVPMTVLGRMQSIGERMTKAASLSDEELAALEDELWSIADRLLARATPPLGMARDLLTLPALLRLLRFLTEGFASTMKSMTSSPSPGSTEEPSPSETSSEAPPSTEQPSG